MNRMGPASVLIANILCAMCIGLSLYFTYLFYTDRDCPLRFVAGILVANCFTFGLLPGFYSFVAAILLRKQLSRILLCVSLASLPTLFLSFGLYTLAEAELGLIG
ncbi:hypothetical protein [Pseudoteredinibacter isoporae]|uniref:Uncharacterized protein n=1 Tax=Pseudoteredinibacter isoporae TaxID=570281 RepID=A0A7X0JT86_9GAMM|nr:hypothetical protein [Pseudoteredinibacter isoporae]MBB6521288.1 hypothetical protein [Pseudoteredinibacter isoporae]